MRKRLVGAGIDLQRWADANSNYMNFLDDRKILAKDRSLIEQIIVARLGTDKTKWRELNVAGQLQRSEPIQAVLRELQGLGLLIIEEGVKSVNTEAIVAESYKARE